MDVDELMATWRATLASPPDDLAERAWRAAFPVAAPRAGRPRLRAAVAAAGALALLGAAVAVVVVRGSRSRPTPATTRATTPAFPADVLRGSGLRARLPHGWHGRIGRGALLATSVPLGSPEAPITSASLDALRPGAVGVLLFEDTGTLGALQGARDGLPRAFAAAAFRQPDYVQPTTRVAYAQQRFVVAGRAFTLLGVSGSAPPPAGALADLNALVASLRVARGDVYPGTLAPPAFAPAPGWHVRAQAPIHAGPSVQVIAAAATVPYADPLEQLPPRATMGRLGPSGVAIRIALVADDRSPPTMPDGVFALQLAPPYRLDLADCARSGLEGAVRGVTQCVLRATVPHRFTVELWAFFAGARATAAQRAATQAELDRITLPAWPYWP